MFHVCEELYVRKDLARRSHENAFSTIAVAITWNENLARGGVLHPSALTGTLESIKLQRLLEPAQIEVLLALPTGIEGPPEINICNHKVRTVGYSNTARNAAATFLTACLAKTRSSILAVLDGRDSMHPDRLQIGLQSLENHDIVSTSKRFPLSDGRWAVTDETQLSGWMFHRHVWDRSEWDTDQSDGVEDRFRSMGFSCCHQVEAGCPLTVQEAKELRPGLLEATMKFGRGSIVARHTLDRPLLERLSD